MEELEVVAQVFSPTPVLWPAQFLPSAQHQGYTRPDLPRQPPAQLLGYHEHLLLRRRQQQLVLAGGQVEYIVLVYKPKALMKGSTVDLPPSEIFKCTALILLGMIF